MNDKDLTNPEFRADPYPTYARLRTEAPVCRVRVGRRNFEDRRNAPATDRHAWGKRARRLFGPLAYNMLGLDEPDHTRLRNLVQEAFAPRLIESMRPRIESLAEELLDVVARRRRMDVIRDYAVPLTTTIIAEMLGVPITDRDRFHRWSTAVATSAFTGRLEMLRLVPNVLAFLRYIRKLVRLRVNQPEKDLISALVAAELAGDKLSEPELLTSLRQALSLLPCPLQGSTNFASCGLVHGANTATVT